MRIVQVEKEYNQVLYLSVEQINTVYRNCLRFSSLYVSDVFYKHITQIFPGLDLMIDNSQYMDAILLEETGT